MHINVVLIAILVETILLWQGHQFGPFSLFFSHIWINQTGDHVFNEMYKLSNCIYWYQSANFYPNRLDGPYRLCTVFLRNHI